MSETQEETKPTPKIPWLAIRLVVGLVVGVVAFNVAKPFIFERFHAPGATQTPTNGAATESAPVSQSVGASPLTEPDNLMMEVTRAGLWQMQTGSYAGWQTPPGTTVAFADTNSIVVTRIVADGSCRVAAIRGGLPVPAASDPSGAACADPARAAAMR